MAQRKLVVLVTTDRPIRLEARQVASQPEATFDPPSLVVVPPNGEFATIVSNVAGQNPTVLVSVIEDETGVVIDEMEFDISASVNEVSYEVVPVVVPDALPEPSKIRKVIVRVVTASGADLSGLVLERLSFGGVWRGVPEGVGGLALQAANDAVITATVTDSVSYTESSTYRVRKMDSFALIASATDVSGEIVELEGLVAGPVEASEYDRIEAALQAVDVREDERHAIARSFAEFGDRDIAQLSSTTGWGSAALRLWFLSQVAADELGPKSRVSTRGWYGVFRAGLPTAVREILGVHRDVFAAALEKALDASIVLTSGTGDEDSFVRAEVTAFEDLLVDQALAGRPSGGLSSYGDLLRASGRFDALAPMIRARILDLAASPTEVVPPNWLDDPALSEFGRVAWASYFCAPIASKLRERAAGGPIGSYCAHHALSTSSGWRDWLGQADLLNAIDWPMLRDLWGIEGPDDIIGELSTRLARRVGQEFATEVFAETLRSVDRYRVFCGDGKETVDPSDVARGLSQAAENGYRLGETQLTKFVSSELDPLVRAAIGRIHRVHQIAAGEASIVALARQGLTSAKEVTSLPFDRFEDVMAASGVGPLDADLIYRRATQVHTTALAVMTSTLAPPAPIAALTPSQASQRPSVESLLGEQTYCACEHCRSVLSPAAYLVDLFDFLPGSNDDMLEGTPYAIFKKRRPDLLTLPLTCENTNELLPAIDIAIEVMENLALPNFSHQGTNIPFSVRRDAAPIYDAIKTAAHPVNAHYDVWADFTDELLRMRGTTTADAQPVLRAVDHWLDIIEPNTTATTEPAATTSNATWFARAGFDTGIQTIFTNAVGMTGAVDISDLYGYRNLADALSGNADSLNKNLANANPAASSPLNAKAIAHRLDLTYLELGEMLWSPFVNPDLAAIPRAARGDLEHVDNLLIESMSESDALKAAAGRVIHLKYLPENGPLFSRALLTTATGTPPTSFAVRLAVFVGLWRRMGCLPHELDALLAVARKDVVLPIDETVVPPSVDSSSDVLVTLAQVVALRHLLGPNTDWAEVSSLFVGARLIDEPQGHFAARILERNGLLHDLRSKLLDESTGAVVDSSEFELVGSVRSAFSAPSAPADANATVSDVVDQLVRRATLAKLLGCRPDELDTLVEVLSATSGGTIGLLESVPTTYDFCRRAKMILSSGIDLSALGAAVAELSAPPESDEEVERLVRLLTQSADEARAAAEALAAPLFKRADLSLGLPDSPSWPPVPSTWTADLLSIAAIVRHDAASLDRQWELEQVAAVVAGPNADEFVASLTTATTAANPKAALQTWVTSAQALLTASATEVGKLVFNSPDPAKSLIGDVIANVTEDSATPTAPWLDEITVGLLDRLSQRITSIPVTDSTDCPLRVAATLLIGDRLTTALFAEPRDPAAIADTLRPVVGEENAKTLARKLAAEPTQRSTLGVLLQGVRELYEDHLLDRRSLKSDLATVLAGPEAPPEEAALLEHILALHGVAPDSLMSKTLATASGQAGAEDSLRQSVKAALTLRRAWRVFALLDLSGDELAFFAGHRVRTSGSGASMCEDFADAQQLNERLPLWATRLVDYVEARSRLGVEPLVLLEAFSDTTTGKLYGPAEIANRIAATYVSAHNVPATPQAQATLVGPLHVSYFVDVVEGAALRRRTKLSEDALRKAIPSDGPTADTVADLRSHVRSLYDNQTWPKAARPGLDRTRRHRRDALARTLYQFDTTDDARPPVTNLEDLYGHLLLDPGTEPVVMTSRIRSAIASTQLFVQRCMMNLEPILRHDVSGVTVSKHPIDTARWDWMKRYRIWEANRKVFLYPENWLLPEFRDHKSHLFEELEGALVQGDLDHSAAEDAILNYLRGLEEIAQLKPVGLYEDRRAEGSVIHLVAKTKGQPSKWYSRRREDTIWTPWQPIDADISGDHAVPIVWNGSLFIFWLTFPNSTSLRRVEPSTVEEPQLEVARHLDPDRIDRWNQQLGQEIHRRYSVMKPRAEAELLSDDEPDLVNMKLSGVANLLEARVDPLVVQTQIHWIEQTGSGWSAPRVSDLLPTYRLSRSKGKQTNGPVQFDATNFYLDVSIDQSNSVIVALSQEERRDHVWRVASKHSRPEPTAPFRASLPFGHRDQPFGSSRMGWRQLSVNYVDEVADDKLLAVRTSHPVVDRSEFFVTPTSDLPSRPTELDKIAAPFMFDDCSGTYFVQPTARESRVFDLLPVPRADLSRLPFVTDLELVAQNPVPLAVAEHSNLKAMVLVEQFDPIVNPDPLLFEAARGVFK